MCYHGTHRIVSVINQQSSQRVKVDACIADEIQKLNDKGIITLGCCCSHGMAGQITEWENDFGKWKTYYEPPLALIHEDSIELARLLGYRPYPYFYADGESYGVWKIHLKTGCITQEDCDLWHKEAREVETSLMN